MISELEQIKNILKKHNYTVNIHATPNGCMARFPGRIEEPQTAPFVLMYQIHPTESKLSITFQDQESGKLTETLSLPLYCMLPYITFHIAKHTINMKYVTNLIMFYDDDVEIEEYQFHELVGDFGMSPKELTNKHKLIELVTQAFQNQFNPVFQEEARKLKIYTGYQIIASLFQNEETVDDT
jgi:hypothetical protein